MSEPQDPLVEIAANTRAIVQLLALSLPKGLTQRLDRVFDSPAKRAAYRASDGARSAREVARLAETTHTTVGRWWDEWLSKGLVTELDDGRKKALLSIDLLTLADRLEEGLK